MNEERYEITSLIGKGRTGGVYTAEDSQLSRQVVVRRFFSVEGNTSAEIWEEQFLSIAHNLCNLQHPNLLTVFDAGIDDDGAFLITQYTKGERLNDRVKNKPLSERETIDLASQILDALASAHAGGFIHGALTPGSILLIERARGGYRYMIMDMGLSRLAPLIQGEDSALAMMADPALLAPELFDGSAATEVSDLYMLGQLLYLCLAGGHPFANKNIDEAKTLHQSDALPPLNDFRLDISPEIIAWIKQLTQINPSQRPSSVTEAIQSLPKPPPAPVPARPQQPAVTYSTQTNLGAALTSTHAIPKTTAAVGLASAQQKSHKNLYLTLAAVAIVGIISLIALSNNEPDSDEFYEDDSSTQNEPTSTRKRHDEPTESDKEAVFEKRDYSSNPLKEKAPTKIKSPDKAVSRRPTNGPDVTSSRSPREITKVLHLLYENSVEEGHTRNYSKLNNDMSDWVVFKSKPSSTQKHSRQNTDIFVEHNTIGNVRILPQPVGNLTFKLPDGTTVRPNCYGVIPKPGDGWKIVLKPTSNTFTFDLHFTMWNTNVKMELRDGTGKKLQLETSEFQSNSNDTSIAIRYQLTKKQLNGTGKLIIKLTATSAKKAGSPMGISLNALTVSEK